MGIDCILQRYYETGVEAVLLRQGSVPSPLQVNLTENPTNTDKQYFAGTSTTLAFMKCNLSCLDPTVLEIVTRFTGSACFADTELCPRLQHFNLNNVRK